MGVPVLVIALALAAALLAVWVDVRWPKLAPTSVRPLVVHLVAALIVCQLAAAGLQASAATKDFAGMMGGVFGLALPALTYAFLAGFWMIKIAQGMLGRAVR